MSFFKSKKDHEEKPAENKESANAQISAGALLQMTVQSAQNLSYIHARCALQHEKITYDFVGGGGGAVGDTIETIVHPCRITVERIGTTTRQEDGTYAVEYFK